MNIDPTSIMSEPKPSMKKAKKKLKPKSDKGYDQLSGGNPKHHLVHVHVNVVNSAQGDTKEKGKGSGNDADAALRNLRGF